MNDLITVKELEEQIREIEGIKISINVNKKLKVKPYNENIKPDIEDRILECLRPLIDMDALSISIDDLEGLTYEIMLDADINDIIRLTKQLYINNIKNGYDPELRSYVPRANICNPYRRAGFNTMKDVINAKIYTNNKYLYITDSNIRNSGNKTLTRLYWYTMNEILRFSGEKFTIPEK